jgi:hypothetical protein
MLLLGKRASPRQQRCGAARRCRLRQGQQRESNTGDTGARGGKTCKFLWLVGRRDGKLPEVVPAFGRRASADAIHHHAEQEAPESVAVSNARQIAMWLTGPGLGETPLLVESRFGWLPGMDSNHDKENPRRMCKLQVPKRPRLPSTSRNPHTGSVPAQQSASRKPLFHPAV